MNNILALEIYIKNQTTSLKSLAKGLSTKEAFVQFCLENKQFTADPEFVKKAAADYYDWVNISDTQILDFLEEFYSNGNTRSWHSLMKEVSEIGFRNAIKMEIGKGT